MSLLGLFMRSKDKFRVFAFRLLQMNHEFRLCHLQYHLPLNRMMKHFSAPTKESNELEVNSYVSLENFVYIWFKQNIILSTLQWYHNFWYLYFVIFVVSNIFPCLLEYYFNLISKIFQFMHRFNTQIEDDGMC